MTTEKGFTLIELLIVIAIMAILSSIAFYGYNQHRLNSAKKVLLADTKNCLNTCLAKLSNNIGNNCNQSDCILGDFTGSCAIDLNGPVYVTCQGKGLVDTYQCSVYQNGSVVCN